jgi:hypothetical protein
MQIAEIRPHLWRWTARHPEWTPEEGWEPVVGSYALVENDTLVLFDPLVPGDEEERFWRALDDDVEHHGPPQILLTVFWHARSTQAILDRYEGSRAFAPAAAESQARERVPTVETYDHETALPGGVEARTTPYRAEALLWLPAHRALVAGDLLLGTSDGGARVCPDSWLRPGVTGPQLRTSLEPLLELPIELLLLTHGEPVLENGHAAFEQAVRA